MHTKKRQKRLQQSKEVIIIMEENIIMEKMIVINPKTFCFNFDFPKDVDKILNCEIEFVIKSNQSLAENKTKNEIQQFMLKCKHGNNIHEYRTQQNKSTT